MREQGVVPTRDPSAIATCRQHTSHDVVRVVEDTRILVGDEILKTHISDAKAFKGVAQVWGRLGRSRQSDCVTRTDRTDIIRGTLSR